MKVMTGVVVLGTAVFFIGLLMMRSRSVPEIAANPMTNLVGRSIRFQRSLRDRHPACSVGQAWQAASLAPMAEAEEISASLKVIRTDGAYTLVQTPAGELWMPSRDIHAIPESILDEREGIYQPRSTGVRAGDTVLDCGANIGVYSKFALANGAAKVIAIEVAPEAIECLRRNLAGEIAAGRVTIYPKGVWDKDATLQLKSSPSLSSMANSVAQGDGSGPVVPLTTIDKIVKELALERVDFIKMDIEGAEANALRGAVETLNRFKPRLAVALEHNRTDPDTLSGLVKSHWPFYRTGFSGCIERGGGAHIQPAVLYAF